MEKISAYCEKHPDSKFNKSLMVAIKTKSGRKTINGNEYKEFINDEVAFEETLNDQTLKEHLKKDFFINN
ncbi:MAG: arylamine N-acetyltransferase [Clostridia bacterium]|nr:arylamine N-acetyltransferase [Clostridia bacterium]